MRHARRRFSWQGVGIFVAAMATGTAFVQAVPETDIVGTPFLEHGTVGETIDLRYADLTVDQVRVAPTVEGFETAVAGGTFLVIDVTWRAKERQTHFAGAEVIDREGRSHYPTNRGGCAKGAKLQAGYDWRTTYCFDLDEKALEGAVVRLARGTHLEEQHGQVRDAAAVVDLGIDAARAAELLASDEPVEIEDPGYAATRQEDEK